MNLDFNIPQEEQHELDLLAAELRDAMPVAELSADFQQRLETRMRTSWTIRSAFESNGLIRAAAALLMVTLAAAPVAAWVGLWPQQKKNPPAIAFDLPEVIDVDESQDPFGDLADSKVIGPVDEFDTFGFSEESTLAIQQSNYRVRLEYAQASLEAADAASVARGDGMLMLFPDLVSRGSGVSTKPGSLNSWPGLWQEFGARCKIGRPRDLSPALLSRCQEALATSVKADAFPEEIAARAAWNWVFFGDVAPAGTVELAWENAPFVASE